MPAEASRRRVKDALPFGLASVFYVVFVARGAFRVNGKLHFSLFDDAMISMTYARNLAHGHGLVWNAGHAPVEGYTNFLWTVWMAGIHLLALPDRLTSVPVIITGLALLLGNLVLVRKIAARLAPGQPAVATAAVWLTAFCYPLVYWTLRGMEVGLVAFLLSAGILLVLDLQSTWTVRRLIMLAAVITLGMLTRDDVAIPAAILIAFAVATAPRDRRRTAAAVLLVTAAAVVLGHTVFRVVYYGHALPNTYELKVGGTTVATRAHRGFEALAQLVVLQIVVPLVFAVALVVSRLRRMSTGIALVAALFVGQCAYSMYVGGDAWEWMKYANRYITPVLPGLFVLAAIGVAEFVHADAVVRLRWVRGAAAAFVVAVAVAAAGWIPTHPLQLPPWGRNDLVLNAALAALPAFAVLYLAQRLGRRPQAAGATFALLIGVALIVSNGQAMASWANHNAAYNDEDAAVTRYGVALRATTRPGATLAVLWAGTIPYFAHRDAVDLLGKSDRVIATEQPHHGVFYPGHTKWDYAYSIGKLRPDVVTQLYVSRPSDPGDVLGFGYRSLPGTRAIPRVAELFVRNDSRLVDADALEAFLRAAGSPGKPNRLSVAIGGR